MDNMSVIRVTKEFSFEMAHALLGYDGSCRFIHGHSYSLAVTVKGSTLIEESHPKNGMVIDFGQLKTMIKEQIIETFDHALVLNSRTPKEFIPTGSELFDKMILVNYQPTSENLVADFANRLRTSLPSGLSLHSVLLRETGSSFAEWHASDND